MCTRRSTTRCSSRLPLAELDAAVKATQDAMGEASAIVLGGFALRTEAKIFRHPDRYVDERGERMWRMVWEVIAEVGSYLCSHTPPHPCASASTRTCAHRAHPL